MVSPQSMDIFTNGIYVCLVFLGRVGILAVNYIVLKVVVELFLL